MKRSHSYINVSYLLVSTLVVVILQSFVLFLYWASISMMPIEIQLSGTVEPQMKTQVVQHLGDGIVDTILVHEGQSVAAGDPLVRLKRFGDEIDVAQTLTNIYRLNARLLRLSAELDVNSTMPDFSQLGLFIAPIIAEEQALYTLHRKSLDLALGVKQLEIDQTNSQLFQFTQMVKLQKSTIRLYEAQLTIDKKLLNAQYITYYDYLAKEMNLNPLISELKTRTAKLNEAVSRVAVLQSQHQQITNEFHLMARQEQQETQQLLEQQKDLLDKLQEALHQGTLVAPVAGIVNEVNVSSIGSVIKSGATVVTLVPQDSELIIEAQLNVNDVGHIHVGQLTKVRLLDHLAARFSALEGEILYISPDT